MRAVPVRADAALLGTHQGCSAMTFPRLFAPRVAPGPTTVEEIRMTDARSRFLLRSMFPRMPPLGRRGLLAGAAGGAGLLGLSTAGAFAQTTPLAPPAGAAPSGGGGGDQSAVIDVNRARAAPIPIAIPDFVGADPASVTLGHNIAQVITNDLGNCGLFRPIAPSAFIASPGAPAGTVPALPSFQNWASIGAQALVTGQAQASGGNIAVQFRLWDVLAQKQLQGTAYTTGQANWRRIAHIIADVIYQRLLGEPGYFDTRIVYVSLTGPRGREAHRLAIMDQDGANNRFLTDGRWMVLSPRFAPKGDQICFMSYANQTPRVYLFNLATGQQRILGDFAGMTFAPRFAPDGRSVVMALAHGGGSAIVVANLATHATQQITNSNSIDVSPCYSPDGSQIVFNSDRDGTPQLYIMNVDGSGVKRISFGHANYTTPVWSPRGDLIAYTRYGGNEANFAIGVMAPDGSGERVIAEGWDVEGPTFCPNGRVLMYFSQSRAVGNRGQGFSSQLMTIDITGFNQRIEPTPTMASDPAWSPLGG
jgi:TolB protein